MTLGDDENWLIDIKKALACILFYLIQVRGICLRLDLILSHTGSGNRFETWFHVYFMVLHISRVVSNFPPKQNKKKKEEKARVIHRYFQLNSERKWSYICITFFEFYWYHVYLPGRSIFAILCCFPPLFGGTMFLCVSAFGSIYLFTDTLLWDLLSLKMSSLQGWLSSFYEVWSRCTCASPSDRGWHLNFFVTKLVFELWNWSNLRGSFRKACYTCNWVPC